MRIKRRRFLGMLGAAGAGTAMLPLLESVGHTAPEAAPVRLIIFFSANGTIPDRWRPQGGETDWTIPDADILAPLKPYRDKLLILEGVDMQSAYNGPGDGHQRGMGHMLTGTEILPGGQKGGCDNCGAAGPLGGPSVDQFIAQKVHAAEAFRSLEFAVQAGGYNTWSRMCASGAGEVVDPEQNPHQSFDRIFGTLGASEARREQLRKRRKSVLDFVRQDIREVKAQVSAADRQRIDQHETAVREMEARLVTGDGEGVACEIPGKGDPFDASKHANFPAAGRAFMDQIVTAMACGLTRVASIQWGRSVHNISHPWIGVSDRHHSLSHEGDSNGSAVDKLVKINRWYSEQFAYLLGKLQAVPEGDGTMLDNTVVVWCNELGKGNSHTRKDVPYVLAGSAGGHFKTGRYLTYDRDPHNNLLVSLCQAMGVQTNTFGNPAYCTGPLKGLTG